MKSYFDENYLKGLLDDLMNGKSREFGIGYNRVEMDIVDAIMKKRGYHKFLRTTSPKFSRCYAIWFEKSIEPKNVKLDNYFTKRIW